jgi:leucyl aminopeptidase
MTKIFTTRAQGAIPVRLVRTADCAKALRRLPKAAAAYAKAAGFSGAAGKVVLAPSTSGKIETVLLGLGDGDDPFVCGALSTSLPNGTYEIAGRGGIDPTLAALAIGFSRYRFDRYRKPTEDTASPQFVWPKGCDRNDVKRILKGVFLARDLINTPAADMGPAEMAAAARKLARQFGAKVSVIRGDKLVAKNFPMIHAVGRASSRPPCLIDLTWGKLSAPKVTLVGKGVCFDTGGLNLKGDAGMLLMKKDMGGGANVLGLASVIMSRKLHLRLRVLIPAVENSVAGNAYRPGDVLASRKGLSVEIGNTDAEGRLVLADALALADEEKPELILDMATLTGAARVALGPELPALFCDDDKFAGAVSKAAAAVGDPLWRMPLWQPYAKDLSSKIADVNHISSGSFAGSVTAALFLQKFVTEAKVWAHVDLMAWNTASRPGHPYGGEAQAIRAVYEVLKARYG